MNLRRGTAFAARLLRDTMFATDLTRLVTALDLPIRFFHGRYDCTVSCAGARSFLEALEAPVKGFYTFEHSAHSPLFEEPERMQRVLREDVRVGANALADAR